MPHEIQQHDDLVLHQQRAWHGLGIVVQDAPTPRKALKIAGLDWEVEQWNLFAANVSDAQSMQDSATAYPIDVESHVLNIRSDTHTQLGIVGADYTPIQNSDLADFCEELAEGNDVVKVESAGSIRNGRKVWFLLKGESFSVRDDEVSPYICVSNGHDGTAALRCTPTTIRVVCSNTLHLVIPDRVDSGGRIRHLKQAGYVCRHTRHVKQRVEEAKAALQIYGKSLESTRQMIDSVAAKEIKSREDVQAFFLECYTTDFGPIPSEAKTKAEEKKRWKAMEASNRVFARFDHERDLVGANYWAAFNAYSGWLQNENQPRIIDDTARREQKTHSLLFGTDAARTHHALEVALSA